MKRSRRFRATPKEIEFLTGKSLEEVEEFLRQKYGSKFSLRGGTYVTEAGEILGSTGPLLLKANDRWLGDCPWVLSTLSG
jgi:hypothetical protein